MKKYMMGFVAACLAVSLCACSAKMDGESINSTEAKTTEIPGSKETEKELSTEAALTTATDKTDNTRPTEATETGKALTTAAEEADREPVTDETTVYKLADGTYMDRIDRRFTYNGTDTWTDEDGVEWNEVVE